jgi:two-component system phosphate regulon sensor histidine kinase PhoR
MPDSNSRVLRSLFAVAVVKSDRDVGRITEVNDLLGELTGWDPVELEGQPLDVLIPERSRGSHHHYRAGFMLHPLARPMGPDREVVILHKNGTEIRVWIGLAPIDRGSVTAVILPMDIGRSYGIGDAQRDEGQAKVPHAGPPPNESGTG